MPISDPENQDEENIASSQLGCGKHQQFQKIQYKPQTTEYTGTNCQLGENSKLGVLNLTYRGHQYHLIDGKVILHASQNQGVDSRKYSMPRPNSPME